MVVLARFWDEGNAPTTLGPFTHLGIEVPEREDIDAIADKARARGCLHWEPRQMWDPIGYICAVKDPDGNVIEFSHDQRVFATVLAPQTRVGGGDELMGGRPRALVDDRRAHRGRDPGSAMAAGW